MRETAGNSSRPAAGTDSPVMFISVRSSPKSRVVIVASPCWNVGNAPSPRSFSERAVQHSGHGGAPLVATGRILGRRVHLNIDYDSERDFAANNDVQVYYEGLEDEIVRRVEIGTVQFRPPPSRFITAAIPTSNFGVNALSYLSVIVGLLLPVPDQVLGGMLAVFAGFFLTFITLERRRSAPMLPLELFRIPAFTGTAIKTNARAA